MTSQDFPALTAPFELAGKRLRNRAVHSSMTTRFQQNQRVGDALIRYHASRAKGGAAMTVTEPMGMIARQETDPKVWVRDPASHDGLKRLADAVERQDCRILGQVQDPGRGRHYPGRSPAAIGAAHLPDDMSWTMPHALTEEEIGTMVREFAESSAILKACGFSGVEISAGHGHLFHQFMSPHSNNRQDGYGGDVAGRTRLMRELVAAIRDHCGPDFILGVKMPGDDGVPDGISPDDAAEITRQVIDPELVSYVTFAQGSHARSLEMHVPDRYGPTMAYMPIFHKLREACRGVPLMALGRITDPAEAEGILARGEAELMGLGRTLIADPAWLNKAVAGRTHDIRYCLSCNTCWGYTTMHHTPLCCVNNPRVGKPAEADFRPAPAPERRRIVIVGAGVAGMEAAWTSAARGHDVTVFGNSAEPGGRTLLRSRLPGGETITSIVDYQMPAATRAGATFRFGAKAGLDDVMALNPDTVILATGAEMLPPAWLPAEVRDEGMVPDLPTAIAPLIDRVERQPGTAVIYDMDHTDAVYAAAELLNQRFEKVVLITPRETIAEDMWIVARQGILRRMYTSGIEIVRLSEPVWSDALEDGNLEYRNVFTGETGLVHDIAFLAYATPRAPRDALVAPLTAAGIEVIRVGDARSPQDLIFATSEGHAAGNRV